MKYILYAFILFLIGEIACFITKNAGLAMLLLGIFLFLLSLALETGNISKDRVRDDSKFK